MKDIDPFYWMLMPKIKAPVMIDTTDPRAIEAALKWTPGQEHHQLHQPRRRRGEIRARLPAGTGLRRGAGRRHHRRGQAAGPGVHPRTQARRRPALRPAADRKVRLRARRHHHRYAGVPLRHRRRELHRRRGRDHRGDPPDQAAHPVHQDHPGRLQHQLRPAGERARSGQLGVPVPRHQGRPRSRHRQCARGSNASRRSPWRTAAWRSSCCSTRRPPTPIDPLFRTASADWREQTREQKIGINQFHIAAIADHFRKAVAKDKKAAEAPAR